MHELIWGSFTLEEPINDQLILLGLVLVAEQIPKEMELSEEVIEKLENSDVTEGAWL